MSIRMKEKTSIKQGFFKMKYEESKAWSMERWDLENSTVVKI